MILKKYTVQPRERRIYTVDCSNWLEDGEILESPTQTAMPVDLVVSGNYDGSFEALDFSISPDSKKFSFIAGGGRDGERVVVTCVMYTSNKQVKEDELLFKIREVN